MESPLVEEKQQRPPAPTQSVTKIKNIDVMRQKPCIFQNPVFKD